MSSTSGYIPNKQATPHALPEYDVPMPMVFTSSRDGWVAVGNLLTPQTEATLYHTTTAGTAWYPIRLPVPSTLQHGYGTEGYQPIFSHDIGTVVFQYMGTRNEIVSYRTANNGETWTASTPVFLGKAGNVLSYFLNPNVGWIMGNSGLLERTTNGGHTWSKIHIVGQLPAMLHQGYSIQQLDMVNRTVGWMMVEKENGMTAAVTTRILKTINGGRTWT